MFTIERFVEQCRAAVKGPDGQKAVRELVDEAVSNPSQLMRALGEPQRAGLNKVYVGDDLTILNLCWGPQMYIQPHDHRVWAVIGIYGGREVNTFFRRDGEGLRQHGNKELEARQTIPLGESIIHAVKNPLDQITAAIHVYAGDFFAIERSQWDPATHREERYSSENTIRLFEESNARLGIGSTRGASQ